MLGLLEDRTMAYVPTQLVKRWTKLHGSPRMPTKNIVDMTMENQWEMLGRFAGIRTYSEPKGNDIKRHDITYSISSSRPRCIWTYFELISWSADELGHVLVYRVQQHLSVELCRRGDVSRVVDLLSTMSWSI
jgi:hypothetical protein